MAESSPQSAEQIVRAQVASLNAGDIDGLMNYYADDCLVREITADGAEIKGHDELRRYLEELLSGLDDFRIEVRHVTTSGDRAALQLVVSGIHSGELYGYPATRSKVSYRVSTFHTIANGKTVLEEAYFDPTELVSSLSGTGVPSD